MKEQHQFRVHQCPRAGVRLDLFLVEQGLGLSRRKIRALIDAGQVTVDGRRERMASKVLTRGSSVVVHVSEDAMMSAKAQAKRGRPVQLIGRGPGFVAIDKPPGMPSQPLPRYGEYHVLGSIEAQKTAEPAFATFSKRAWRLVHRLDQETTGVLLVAQSHAVAERLGELFRAKACRKNYLALVYGLPESDRWSRTSRLSALSPRDQRVREVSAGEPGGRTAVTQFVCLQRFSRQGLSLIECLPETGRTHQIRVHLNALGLPIVGDKRYGNNQQRLPRHIRSLAESHHMLHAAELGFSFSSSSSEQDSGQVDYRFSSPLPQNFHQILTKLEE